MIRLVKIYSERFEMHKKITLMLIIISLFSIVGCADKDNKECNHNSVEWIINKETLCTEDGEKALKCVDCNKVLQTVVIERTGHNYLEVANSAIEATYEHDGKEANKKCSRCEDEIIGNVIPMLVHEHTFSSVYTYNDQIHWKESTCGHDITFGEESHTIHDGECIVCGYKEVIVLEPSEYLEFTSYKSNTSYAVKGLKADANIKDIEIPTTYDNKPVIRIESNAFKNASIDSIIIPEGIVEIGENAFRDSSVQEISLPSTIKKIDDYAFNGCSKLTRFFANSALTSSILIGKYKTFGILDSLIEASVPADLVQKLNTSGGYSASKLEKLSVNGGKVIKGPSNKFTNLKTLIISEGVEEISSGAFDSTLLVELNLPSTLTTIGYSAFANIVQLQTVNIAPNSKLTSIGKWAFNSSGLCNITLPNSLSTIGENAFTNTNIVSITIPGSIKTISSNCFAKCSKLTSVIVENGVEEIQLKAFSECSLLNTVVLPDSIVTLGENIFELCTSLTSVNIPLLITNIPNYLFYKCSSLNTIVIPSSVTTIGLSAFGSCVSLVNLTFNEGLKSIAKFAFSGCSSLTNIVFPSGLTDINDYAFSSTKLLNVLIPITVTYIGDGSFSSEALLFYEGTKPISGARYNCNVIYYCETNPYSSQYWHYVDGVPTKWTA